MDARPAAFARRPGIVCCALGIGALLGWLGGWALDAGYFTPWREVRKTVPAQAIVDARPAWLTYRGIDGERYGCSFGMPFCLPYADMRDYLPIPTVLPACPSASPAYSPTARNWFAMTGCAQAQEDVHTTLVAIDDQQRLWFWAYRQRTGAERIRPFAAVLGTLVFGGVLLWAYDRRTRRAALRRPGLAR